MSIISVVSVMSKDEARHKRELLIVRLNLR